jgi:cystathionine beta-synthase
MLNDVTALIGNTPLLHLANKKNLPSEIYIKLESYNPGGSIKDRVALRMIEQNERSGKIQPGMELVEATSGNTGISIAWIGKLKGYKVTIVTHDKISKEKLAFLRHLDANIIITNSNYDPDSPGHHRNIAREYATKTKSFFLDQFSSPFNAEAHYFTTAPEIYSQTQGNVDVIICGIGSGGTITGLSNYFKTHYPKVKIIAADPVGSIFHTIRYNDEYKPKFSCIEGIGSNFIPDIYDKDAADDIINVSDVEAISACKNIYESDAVDIGLSSGAILAVASNIACEGRFKNIVCISPDAGERYISRIMAF